MQISATTYNDFLLAAGTARLTVVRKAYGRYTKPYRQREDFYRPVREAIKGLHRSGRDRSQLRALVADVDERRREHFDACVDGYAKWIGRKRIMWFRTPERVIWQAGELAVSIFPELGLSVNGTRYYIKLHATSAPISQRKANILLQLVAKAVPDDAIKPAVLDVRRSRLFTSTAVSADLDIVLRSEALSFVAMWREIESAARKAAV